MKTTDAARALIAVANALKQAPFDTVEEIADARPTKVDTSSVDVPRALRMLVALSSFDKYQWQQVIRDYDFPIDVRPRDASRDIMGKLLTYLERNPAAQKKLTQSPNRGRSETSPELTHALEILLKS